MIHLSNLLIGTNNATVNRIRTHGHQDMIRMWSYVPGDIEDSLWTKTQLVAP
jgi:hypothetical protein